MTSPYRPVLTKRDFVRRFLRDEFGNRGQNWNTLEEFLASGYRGLVHVRNRQAWAPSFYNIPSENVPAEWSKAHKIGNAGWYLAAMAPHHRNLLQGEVRCSPRGLELYGTKARGLPMRDALKAEEFSVQGIIALAELKKALCPNSMEWLRELLNRYPGHVIEFSSFSCPWGTLYPNYNTAFWEVRLY